MICFRVFYIAVFTLSAVRGSVPNEDDILGSPVEQLLPFRPATFSQHQPTTAQPRAVISGLLVSRQVCQNPGYGPCSNSNYCCPIGGSCCNSGGCCSPGDWCYSTFCCPDSHNGCDNKGCCERGTQLCCKGGKCCPVGWYCDTGGCCPNGKICSGTSGQCADSGYVPCANENFCCPPGSTCYRDSNNVGRCRSGGGSGNTLTVKPTTTHSTTHEQPHTTTHEAEPTTTHEAEPTTTHEQVPPTTDIPPPPISNGPSLSTTSTSSTRSDPTTVPSATAGSENVVIDVSTNTNITWQGPWTDVTSSCSSSSKAKACHSTGSDNFNTVKMEYNFTGTSVYVNIASDNTRFSISIDGEATDYGSASTASGAETFGNCTFGWSRTNLTPGTPHVLEIILFGPAEDSLRRAPAAPAPFTLEIQNFVITQNDTTAAAAGGPNAASAIRSFGSGPWLLSSTTLAIGIISLAVSTML
ncbi:hypothetical protein B0H13DRAFT_2269494 [Mycena leptocephala]|nr:hypothetical protein B0H13DRAFT_2269494 [Mycena leptocephala]